MNKTPRNEREALLKAIADGSDVNNIQPNSTENYWLKQISSNGISSIKDVTELPNPYGWKGTPVTKDTKRVYLNTALSGEEVNNIIDEFLSKIGIEKGYNLIIFEDGNYNLGVEKGKIGNIFDGKIYFENGEWVIENDYVDYNYEIVDEVGEYNDLLSSLISTTPFEKETFNDKTIYRLEEQDTSKLVEVKGQAIPCDDKTYITQLKFNENLTVEQVVEIINNANLQWEQYDGYKEYIITMLKDKNNEIYLYIRKYDDGNITIADSIDNIMFSENEFGDTEWYVYGVSQSTYEGQPIGLQNDKLKDLFYYTTYGTKTNLYTYDGEWCKLVKERPLKVIDVSDITETDDSGYFYLDLSNNGDYIITNKNNISDEILHINFKQFSIDGLSIGKFISINANHFVDTLYCGYEEEDSFIRLNTLRQSLLVKVNEKEVFVFAANEI